MATPYMGEIKIVSFNFPPKGWAACNGQLLPINQNQALFSLFGTTYGGNGQTNFALPDMRGRVPLHMGAGFTEGQAGGQETHTITIQEMPQHLHFAQATTATGSVIIPAGNVLATTPAKIYGAPTTLTALNPGTVSSIGGSQAHENRMPLLALEYIVALQGVFPSRN